jgi:hypothetical protein
MTFVATSRSVIFLLLIVAEWAALYKSAGVSSAVPYWTATLRIVGSSNTNKPYLAITQSFCDI